jgi:hypothetical protein
MKKFLKVSLALTLAGTLVLAGYSIYHSSTGNTVRAYARFMKEDEEGNKSFNWISIIDPFQVESQELIKDTVRFSKKVIYPVAHDFKCKAPQDSLAEKFVALEISTAIKDTLKERYRLVYDYDGQSTAVRRAAKPHTIPTEEPKIFLSMEGTASPEALKYGLEESLRRGHIEDENVALAKERLDRTNSLLSENLDGMGIDSVTVVSSSYRELQLSSDDDIPDAIESPHILDSMRYVKADVVIPLQYVQITPLTSPVLLFLWLLGIIALISFLRRLLSGKKVWEPRGIRNLRKDLQHTPKTQKVRDYRWVRHALTSITIILGAIALGYLLHLIPFETLWWWFIIFVIIAGLAALATYIYLLIVNRKEIWPFFREILIFFRDIVIWIVNAVRNTFIAFILILLYLFFLFADSVSKVREWWSKRCSCCKILMVLLTILILFNIYHFIFKH